MSWLESNLAKPPEKKGSKETFTDQQNNTPETIPAKDYMAATKIIREHRIQLFTQQNENHLTENAKRPEIKTTPRHPNHKSRTPKLHLKKTWQSQGSPTPKGVK